MDNVNIQLEITAASDELVRALFPGEPPVVGARRDVPELNGSLELVERELGESFGLQEVIGLVVSVGSMVAAQVLATWIANKIGLNAVSIKVNGRRCRLDRESLEAILADEMGTAPEANASRAEE